MWVDERRSHVADEECRAALISQETVDPMMPVIELFVQVYVLVDDGVKGGGVPIPQRPGPPPACSAAEVMTVTVVRHVLGRPSERGFLAEVRREWPGVFPHRPTQREFTRRARWRWGACEWLRQQVLATVPEDPCQQIDPTARPVNHPSRGRGAATGDGPADWRAGVGRAAAHGEWFYGFRRGRRTDLGTRVIRTWEIAPAAVDERAVADDLLGSTAPAGRLLDRGFIGQAWDDAHAQRGTCVVLAHRRAQRPALPRAIRRPVAALRNRIETTIGELTDSLGLARHRAKTFWGLLTRTAASILAHTLIRLGWISSTSRASGAYGRRYIRGIGQNEWGIGRGRRIMRVRSCDPDPQHVRSA